MAELSSPTVPTEDGNYADSGGYLWEHLNGRWTFLGDGAATQPRAPLEEFAPFTRLLPERPVPGIAGSEVERGVFLTAAEARVVLAMLDHEDPEHPDVLRDRIREQLI